MFTPKTAWVASTSSSLSQGLRILVSAGLLAFLASPASGQTLQITNPLIAKRADPFLYRHTDGYYYFTATVPEYDRIELRRATSLQGLSTAPTTVIWTRHTSGAMAAHIWAPELHYIDAKWYVYFAAGSSTNVWDIRVYVLENASANPLDRTWTEKGQLVTNGTTFALDATTFEHQGTRYLVWAEDDPTLEINTALFIAPMSNPWTLKQKGVRISVPELAWEKVGYAVNEGPAVLKRNGKIFVSYSAAATDANYCMGLLTAADTSDLLNPGAWTKSATPVFKSGNGIYGPGHNQFTTTPDGATDLLVYHARDYEKITGDPLNDPNRATRVQPLTWNSDGSPNWGSPQRDGTITIASQTQGGAGGTTNTSSPGTSGGTATTSAARAGGGASTSGSSKPATTSGGAATSISTSQAASGGVTTSSSTKDKPQATGGGGANSGTSSGLGGGVTVSNATLGGTTNESRASGAGAMTSEHSGADGGSSMTTTRRSNGGTGGKSTLDERNPGGASSTAVESGGCSCRSTKPSTPLGVLGSWLGSLALVLWSRRRSREN